MYNVFFKDKSTYDFPIVTNDIGRRQRAEEEVDRIEIPNRNGPLLVHTGKYNGYERAMKFTLTDYDYLGKVLAWLKGRGELRTDLEPGGYFRASILSDVSVDAASPKLNELSFSFYIDPFFYLDDGVATRTFLAPGTIINPGTHYAEPIITVFGSGNITLNINSDFVALTNIVDQVTMDSELKACYRDTLSMGKQMVGEYLTLREGANHISWEGNVTKIEITPRWREL